MTLGCGEKVRRVGVCVGGTVVGDNVGGIVGANVVVIGGALVLFGIVEFPACIGLEVVGVETLEEEPIAHVVASKATQIGIKLASDSAVLKTAPRPHNGLLV